MTAGYSGEIDVKDGAILTLDDGTTVSGGTLKIAHGSELLVESSHGATLDGVDVINHGTIQVDILADSATVPLVLTGDTIIDGGKLAVGSDGLVQVEGRGATFDGVKVDVSNGGEIDVGQPATHTHTFFESHTASGTILTLDDDTTVSGGTLVIESNGEVDVEAGHTGTGATLKGVDVVNSGLIQVEEGAVLDLEGDTIAGGTLNTIGYPPSYGQDGGVIEVLAKGGTTTFDGSASKVTVEGYVQVAAGAELELKGRIDLDSADNLGIIELDQTQSPHAKGSTLEISGAVTLSGNGYIALEGSKTSIVAAQNGATLTNKSNIFGGGNIGHDGDGALTFINAGLVEATAAAAGHIVIDTGTTTTNTGTLDGADYSELDLYGKFNNSQGNNKGLIEATGTDGTVALFDATIVGGKMSIGTTDTLAIENGTSTLDGVSVTDSGNIQVDCEHVSATLVLQGGTTIKGADVGTLTLGTATPVATVGMLDVEGTGATLDGLLVTAKDGGIEVGVTTTSGTVLTLDDGTTITGGTLAVGSAAHHTKAEVDIETGGATFDGVAVTLTNGSTIDIDKKTITAVLTLDDNASISGGAMTVGDSGELDVQTGATGTGATLSNIKITNDRLIQVEEGATLNLYGVTVAGGTINTVGSPYAGGGVVEVRSASTFDGSSNGALTVEGDVKVAAGASLDLSGTIKLDGSNGAGIIEADHAGATGSSINISGTTTLTGNGYVVLTSGETGIIAAASGAVLKNQSSIFGAGDIGNNGDGKLTFNNSGLVYADGGAAGHIFIDTGTVTTNTGTLDGADYSELDLYGTFKNAQGNSKGLIEATGTDGTVALFNATIQGGNVSVGATDVLSVIGGGNTSILDGVAATVTGAVDVGSTVTGAILMLDDGATIAGGNTGTLTVTAGNTLDIEKGTGSGQHSGATLDGVNVTDHGSIDVGDVASGAILTLDDGTVITGDEIGKLVIHSGDTLAIEPQSGATLDGVIVTDDGSITVDPGHADSDARRRHDDQRRRLADDRVRRHARCHRRHVDHRRRHCQPRQPVGGKRDADRQWRRDRHRDRDDRP